MTAKSIKGNSGDDFCETADECTYITFHSEADGAIAARARGENGLCGWKTAVSAGKRGNKSDRGISGFRKDNKTIE